jgi:hypothetical protein
MTKKSTTPPTSKPQATPTTATKPLKAVTAPKSKTKPLTEAITQVANEKVVKAKKPKQVRDSFTLPKTEYAVLGELKERAAQLTHSVKKSELLRAGIKALAAMTDANFLSALKAVPAIKTGRPKK